MFAELCVGFSYLTLVRCFSFLIGKILCFIRVVVLTRMVSRLMSGVCDFCIHAWFLTSELTFSRQRKTMGLNVSSLQINSALCFFLVPTLLDFLIWEISVNFLCVRFCFHFNFGTGSAGNVV